MKKILFTLSIMILGISLISCQDTEETTGNYEPGVYYAVEDHTKVSIYISVNELGEISNVIFDQPYQQTTKQAMGDSLVLDSGHTWMDETNYLASYLVVNQGWKDIEFLVDDIEGLTALNAPDSFIEVDYVNSPNDFSYFTLPVDGFLLAWNEAIAKATSNNYGVVAEIPSSEDWVNANKPPYELLDGIYYGKDIAHGYICRVEIIDGYIVDVIFDNITAVKTRVIVDDNGTPNDTSDDTYDVEIIEMTTKQALGDDLVISSGTQWYVQAEMMADAIVDHQGWADTWLFTTSEGHEYLTMGIDGVAGVTIAIEGFRVLFNDAIEQAIVD